MSYIVFILVDFLRIDDSGINQLKYKLTFQEIKKSFIIIWTRTLIITLNSKRSFINLHKNFIFFYIYKVIFKILSLYFIFIEMIK